MPIASKLQSKRPPKGSSKTPRPLRRGMIHDPISPKDFRELDFMFCCEQCTHFHLEKGFCSMGHLVAQHLKEAQLDNYNRTGRMAICRNHEID